MTATKAQFPEKAAALFRPAPFKVFHGGRGSAKTWSFCRALLLLGTQQKLFILCTREIQRSIAESVHRVLSTQAQELGLDRFYTVLQHKIIGTNGTEFVFAGIRNNIAAIKSMEGIDICAVFEAGPASENSWTTLLPTVRRDAPHGPFGKGSEVWIEFNPELDSDYTYKYWVLAPPGGTVRVEMNWRDNPWFPEFLKKQKDELRKRDYESYLTIWEGKVRRVLQGAIYAKQLEAAQNEGRISPDILADRAKPVDISADLGRGDSTTLWFWQQDGLSYRAVDYYGNFGFDWAHYLEQIQERKFIVRNIYLPHDAAHERLEAKKSIAGQTRAAYPGEGRVVVVPKTPSVVNDINAVRAMFPRMSFNEKTCADGITALAHYRYEVDEKTKEVAPRPLHDWASHPADGLRTYVMGLKSASTGQRPQKHQPQPMPPQHDGKDWMAV